MKDVSNLSLEELLNILPASLELPLFMPSSDRTCYRLSDRTAQFNLHIQKLSTGCEEFECEGDVVKNEVGEEAWLVKYVYVYFEDSQTYPCRKVDSLQPIPFKEMDEVKIDFSWHSGIIDKDLKSAVLKLINWLQDIFDTCQE